MHAHPTPLHHVASIGPFAQWGIDFMQCIPTSRRGYCYIIVVANKFMKWAEAMSTSIENNKTAIIFMFNHIITWFEFPKVVMIDHRSHLCNKMMTELSSMLGFHQENSYHYYFQENG